MHKRAFPQLQDRHRPQHSKRLESASGGELVQRFDGLDGLTYQGDISNAPATVSVLNSSTISTVELVDLRGGCSAAPPVNLVGGGSYRFPGIRPPDRHQLAASIDAELGVPAREPVIRIPRRAEGTRGPGR